MRVSVDNDGHQANNHSFYPSLSADGRYVAFESAASNLVPGDANDEEDIFIHDRKTGRTARIIVDSDGNQVFERGSFSPALSADGRYVAFESAAKTFVPDDKGYIDVFVHGRGPSPNKFEVVVRQGN